MVNPTRNQKIESKSVAYSKEPTATFDPNYIQKMKSVQIQSFKREKKIKTDPVQLIITAAIFIFLAVTIYFILGPISMVAMAMGGGLALYHMIGSKEKNFAKSREGRKGPSIFLLVLIGSPFVMGGLVAYEGVTLLEAPTRIILLSAMTISFWTTMLFVPMSVLSKHRETLQPDLKHYPKVSVIIPAYNEEKVIKKTLESMIETHYPRK
jgi:hypothetical protein